MVIHCPQVDYTHDRRVHNKIDDQPLDSFVNSWQAAIKEHIVADSCECDWWQMWLWLRVSNNEYDSVQKLAFEVNTVAPFNDSNSTPQILACFDHIPYSIAHFNHPLRKPNWFMVVSITLCSLISSQKLALTTLCSKKQPVLCFLVITLTNEHRFSQFFYCEIAQEIFYRSFIETSTQCDFRFDLFFSFSFSFPVIFSF